MTSGNLFFKLMKEDGKRRLWASALTFLIFFFFMPVRCAMMISEDGYQELKELLFLQRRLAEWFRMDNGFLAALMVCLSLLMGVTGFSYLHSKQKVDFYHSIPVSRTKLFLANYTNGILIPAMAYAVNMLAALAVMAASGVATGEIAAAAVSGYGFFMLHYLMMYSFTVLAMVLTGNVVVGILGTIVFSIYFPTLIFILGILHQEFFATSYRSGPGILLFLLDKSSPMALFIGNIAYDISTSTGQWILRLLAVALVFIIVTAADILIYKKRGSEAAGRAMAFPASQIIIRIPLVIVCGLLGGILFWSFRIGSLGWIIFGILCGAMISHCIIEIIFHFDFKKLLQHKAQLALCALASAAVFAVFYFDLTGYDRYLPKESQLKSVAITMDYGSGWVDYGTIEENREGLMGYRDQNGMDYRMDSMKITEFGDVLALAEEGIRQAKGGSSAKGVEEEWDTLSRHVYFSVGYRLKSGRRVYRSYTVNAKHCQDLFYAIYDLPEYKQGAYPILSQTGGDLEAIRLTQGERKQELNQLDGAAYDRILAAYQEEFMALSSRTMKEENPVAVIQFVTGNQLAAEKNLLEEYGSSSWRYQDMREHFQYPVYPSFTKTISLLEEYGLELREPLKTDHIVRIQIDPYQFYSTRYDSELKELEINDPNEIEELMQLGYYAEYQYMNVISYLAEDYRFYAIEKNGDSISCRISSAVMPEFLRERIKAAAEAAG